ncbi:MAG: hypothetical protein Q9166_006567 [cf. Caloplaca sp. 2 TL-2023]
MMDVGQSSSIEGITPILVFAIMVLVVLLNIVEYMRDRWIGEMQEVDEEKQDVKEQDVEMKEVEHQDLEKQELGKQEVGVKKREIEKEEMEGGFTGIHIYRGTFQEYGMSTQNFKDPGW